MEPWLCGVRSPVSRARRARKPVRVDAGRACRRLAAAPAPPRRAWRVEPLASRRRFELTRRMRVFALVDSSMVQLVEFSVELFARREDADRTLAELLHDELEWRDLFRIEEIDLGEPSMN